MCETWVQYPGWENPLDKEMATHSSTLAWKILWTEECGRLQSMGLQRVGHDWATSEEEAKIHFFLSYMRDDLSSLSFLLSFLMKFPRSAAHKPLNVCVWMFVCAQLCLILCDPIDCSPPGPSVHWIFQARILEWVAVSFSRGSSWQVMQSTCLCLLHWWQILYHQATWEDHRLLSSLKWAVSVDSLTPAAF